MPLFLHVIWLAWSYIYYLFALFCLFLGYVTLFCRRSNLPGPYGLPFFGYLPFLGKELHLSLTKLAERYGAIYQIRLGHRIFVVLNNTDVIQSAFNSYTFAGRPHTPSMDMLGSCGPSRFAFRSGDKQWRFFRKTSLKCLYSVVNSGRSDLVNLVNQAFTEFSREIDEFLDTPVDPRDIVFQLVSGVIGGITYGIEFDPKNTILQNAVETEVRLAKFMQVDTYMDNLVFGRFLFRNRIKELEKEMDYLNQLNDFHLKLKTGNPVDRGEPSDIQDALLQISVETPLEEKIEVGVTNEQIWSLSHDLFGAGFSTTMEVFRWFLNLMAHYSTIQEEIQVEIGRSIDIGSPAAEGPAILEASIMETLRFATTLPFALPHATLVDTYFEGYFIPKGSTVLANVWAVHHDDRIFPNPYRFDPKRFMSENGKLHSENCKKVLAFSVGKRRCVGEQLAKRELLLLCFLVLQRYRIRHPSGVIFDPYQALPGFPRNVPPYQLIFSKRDVAEC